MAEKENRRIFFIILDSFGIGAAPDAADFGDAGTNTLAAVAGSPQFDCPNLARLGLFNIDGVSCGAPAAVPAGSFARMRELSRGKDTIIGHWELAGLVSERPMPTFPNGFTSDFVREFEKATGRRCICNRPYSGTQVIADYGEEHMKTGALIIYTSADSVLQIAANEAVVPVPELYRYCEIARKMTTGALAVGRVIARPFVGTTAADFRRTARRHDYALSPFAPTMLDVLKEAGRDVIGVGKIGDIFNGQGLTESLRTTGNADGMEKTLALQERDFTGLCFVNLVDFDMLYGHRRDADGYAGALTAFDRFLSQFLPRMRADDVLMISADHGCDPSYLKSTDHTREYVPYLLYGEKIRQGVNLGTSEGFTLAANTICGLFGLGAPFAGESAADVI